MTAAYLVLALVALAASVLVVAARRTVHSALYLLVSLLAMAGLFIILGAEFIAGIQVVVYAGSVVVLFVFVVMTVGFREASSRRRPLLWWASMILLGLVILGELVAALSSLSPGQGACAAGPVPSDEVTRGLGRLIFTEWLLPLEVFSFLILAVMVGIAALRREGRGRP